MKEDEIKIKLFEYRMAQEMVRHYDSLNWYIGSILIGSLIVITGIAINSMGVASIGDSHHFSILSIPFLSLFVLGVWLLWFRRHRNLYNYRNEVLHRIEFELGMYHHLLVVESDLKSEAARLGDAKKNAGYGEGAFEPLYTLRPVGPSGYSLAKVLTFGIPAFQLVVFVALVFA